MSLSVAAIQPPAAIYREEQYFPWWVYAALVALLGIAWFASAPHGRGPLPAPGAARGPRADLPASLLIGLLLPPILVVGVLRMTTEVSPGTCRVWYGIVPTYRRSIALDGLLRVEVVRYRAIRDHGFWGVRTTRDGERVMTARGNRAVRLHFADGTRALIGSQKPEDLAAALEGAMRPVG